LTAGFDPVEVHKAYPELSKKWDAIMGYISDAQTPAKVTELYNAYPELSNNIKESMYGQVSKFMQDQNPTEIVPEEQKSF